MREMERVGREEEGKGKQGRRAETDDEKEKQGRRLILSFPCILSASLIGERQGGMKRRSRKKGEKSGLAIWLLNSSINSARQGTGKKLTIERKEGNGLKLVRAQRTSQKVRIRN